jgi:diacylglycerol kinase (ATP)
VKLLLLVNPLSGRLDGKRHGCHAARLLEKEGVDVECIETHSFDQSVETAKATTRDDCDILVVVGGDGTANAVANGLCRAPAGERPALGLIPCGRGNDFAAMLGTPDQDSAIRALLQGGRRRVDVGKTDAGYFLGIAGAGFDSKVARRAQRQMPFLSGTGVYVFALLRTLTDFRPIRARITHDSGTFEGPIMFAVAGNTDRYGGGMRITPQASLEDGLLDLCIVKEVTRVGLLRAFPRVFSGSHLDHPAVFYTQTRTVTIESSEPAEVFADGEYIQSIPVRIEVERSALEVVVPISARHQKVRKDNQ